MFDIFHAVVNRNRAQSIIIDYNRLMSMTSIISQHNMFKCHVSKVSAFLGNNRLYLYIIDYDILWYIMIYYNRLHRLWSIIIDCNTFTQVDFENNHWYLTGLNFVGPNFSRTPIRRTLFRHHYWIETVFRPLLSKNFWVFWYKCKFEKYKNAYNSNKYRSTS